MSDTIDERDASAGASAVACEDELARHNAGGWPAQGFSQSSGIHDVWNIWIIYPAMAWVFLTVVGGLIAYLRKPISESQIRREIERQSRS